MLSKSLILYFIFGVFTFNAYAQTPAPTKDATKIENTPAKTEKVEAKATENSTPVATANSTENKTEETAVVKENSKKITTPETEKVQPKKEKKSGWKISLHGFARGDLSYNMGHVFHLDSPLFAYSDSDNDPEEKALSYTGRMSRIKISALSPKWNGWNSKAYMEMDFYGNLPNSGTGIRQGMVRMRLAYAELKNKNTTIRFGNDWMVAAPQFASTLEPFNLWGQGNLWMRYPQIKFVHNHPLGEKFRIEAAFSVGQDMAGDNVRSPNSTALLISGGGENSGIPTVQARLGAGFKIGKASWSTFGVSYSWQQIKMSALNTVDSTMQGAFADSDNDMTTASFFALDTKLLMKFNKVSVKATGEFYQGKGTGMYWGAILNGIATNNDPANPEAVLPESRGFFADLKVSLPLHLAIFGGIGQDSIINTDDLDDGKRIKNTMIYAGVNYSIGGKKPIAIIGLSFAKLTTEYKNMDDGNANLIHALLTVPF